MADAFVGCIVSVSLASSKLRVKGTVIRVDPNDQSITLKNVSRSDTNLIIPEMVLIGKDIGDLQLMSQPIVSSSNGPAPAAPQTSAPQSHVRNLFPGDTQHRPPVQQPQQYPQNGPLPYPHQYPSHPLPPQHAPMPYHPHMAGQPVPLSPGFPPAGPHGYGLPPQLQAMAQGMPPHQQHMHPQFQQFHEQQQHQHQPQHQQHPHQHQQHSHQPQHAMPPMPTISSRLPIDPAIVSMSPAKGSHSSFGQSVGNGPAGVNSSAQNQQQQQQQQQQPRQTKKRGGKQVDSEGESGVDAPRTPVLAATAAPQGSLPGTPTYKRREKGGRAHAADMYASSDGGDEGQGHRNQPAGGRAQKDRACFGVDVGGGSIEEEFDFEKNLALFDKATVFAEIMEHDTVHPEQRLVAINKRPQNFRHDEMILEPASNPMNEFVKAVEQIRFTTDNGVIVPAIDPNQKEAILRHAQDVGMSASLLVENAGRSACQMVVQLIGGSRRINPRNLHQTPLVVVLVADGFAGATAVCAARHMTNHHVKVIVCVVSTGKSSELLASQLALFESLGQRVLNRIDELPANGATPVDLIVDGLCSDCIKFPCWADAVAWANGNKAQTLAIDFPSGFDPKSGRMLDPKRSVSAKWTLALGLPLRGLEQPTIGGQLFLADIGLPMNIFAKAGIRYYSPFSDKYVISIEASVIPSESQPPIVAEMSSPEL